MTAEHPILYTADSVRAYLEDRKTQTRRVVNLPNAPNHLGDWEPTYLGGDGTTRDSRGILVPRIDGIWHTRTGKFIKCPYGQVGGLLWVRETHYRYGHWIKNGLTKTGRQRWQFKPGAVGMADPHYVHYFDTPPKGVCRNKESSGWFKRPSIFMPRWASRLTQTITGVWVQRLADLTEEDAVAEGVETDSWQTTQGWKNYVNPGCIATTARTSYESLWNKLNRNRGYGWESNVWVWVISYPKYSEEPTRTGNAKTNTT